MPPRASAAPRIVVTIDGPGGVGKSTVAKLLAHRLGIMYLDTGATYRALAYAAREKHLNPVADVAKITTLARRLPLWFESEDDGALRVMLDGKDISDLIRTEGVTEAAAQVSQHATVRKAMVTRQRKLANAHGVVVEGRDTGTVVFPKASHKFFLDANPKIRAVRRQHELQKRYGTGVSLTEVKEQLDFRDSLDRTRHVGPLKKPRGAVEIDTSHLTAHEVVKKMLRHIGPLDPAGAGAARQP